MIASMPYEKFNLQVSLDKIISTANCLVSGVGLKVLRTLFSCRVLVVHFCERGNLLSGIEVRY